MEMVELAGGCGVGGGLNVGERAGGREVMELGIDVGVLTDLMGRMWVLLGSVRGCWKGHVGQ